MTADSSEPTYPASLVQRARARTITQTSDGNWLVRGETKLGDTYENYLVLRRDGHWHCDCYNSNYGETRQRKTCSHVLAVMLYVHRPQTPIEREPESEPRDLSDFGDSIGALPEWVKEIRPHQLVAVDDVMRAYEDGADVVILDAPTGSGKTLIAELVRRRMQTRALYVCSDKGLQDQFARDFPYADVLKGRANYPTQHRDWPQWSAADCMGDGCNLCDSLGVCKYVNAKTHAMRARLAVINTAYLLAEANTAGGFSNWPLIIADECDTLERALMGYVEFRLNRRMLGELRVDAPKKGSHKATIREWLLGDFSEAISRRLGEMPHNLATIKEIQRLTRAREQAREVAKRMTDNEDGQGSDNWIRDNDAGPVVMRPIRVAEYTPSVLWKHAPKWLLMSATVISGEQLSWSLGIEQAEKEWQVVRVPMTFPIENRPTYLVPVANMALGKRENESYADAKVRLHERHLEVAKVIDALSRRHEDGRILVHCVSYELAHTLADAIGGNGRHNGTRKCFSYANSGEREAALAMWQRSSNGIMFAPSLDRGVDLKDDQCRVQIIAKVPFPFLGDVQVNALLHSGREGGLWYATETVRTIVQMTGRAVRSEDDHAVAYVLDSQFISNVWAKNKMLFPEWWRDAVITQFDVRALLRESKEQE